MKKKTILFFILIFIVGLKNNWAQAPDWTRVLQANNYALQSADVVTTDASFAYIAGSICGSIVFEGNSLTNVGYQDLVLSKINGTGTVAWTKQFNAQAAGTIIPNAINTDASGNIYVSCSFSGTVTIGSSTISSDAANKSFLAKFDPNGNGLWATKYIATGTATSKIATDGSSNVYLISSTTKLIKFSTTGTFQWEQVYPPRTLKAIAVYGSDLYIGGALQSGSTTFGTITLTSLGGNNTGFLVKADLDGVYSASMVVGGSLTNDGSSVSDIALDNTGNLIITGAYTKDLTLGSITISNVPPGLYGRNYTYIAKCDNTFTFSWAKSSTIFQNDLRDMVNYRVFTDNSNNIYEYGAIVLPFNYGSVAVNPNNGQFLVMFDSNGDATSSYSLQNTTSNRIAIAPAGKVITVGSYNYKGAPFFGNFYCNQYSAGMSLEWQRNSSGAQSGTMQINSIKHDASGNTYIQARVIGYCDYFGTIISSNNYLTVISKHNKDGNLIWMQQIPDISANNFGQTFTLDKDNNVLTVGLFQTSLNVGNITLSSKNSGNEGYVAKYSTTGEFLWASKMNLNTNVSINTTLAADNDGNVIVTGVVAPSNYLIKFDALGNQLWAKIFPMESVYLSLVSTDASNNIYLTSEIHLSDATGSTTIGTIPLTQTYNDGSTALIKFDPNGNALWAKTYGGVSGASYSDGWACDIKNDAAGNSYLWGWCSNNAVFGAFTLSNPIGTQYSFYLAKINTSGDVVWAKAVHEKYVAGAGFNYGDLLDLDKAGNLYVGGHFKDQISIEGTTYQPEGINDFFVAKYSNSGAFQWIKTIPSNNSVSSQDIKTLSVLNNNNLTVGGFTGKNSMLGSTAIVRKGGSSCIVATLGNILFLNTSKSAISIGRSANSTNTLDVLSNIGWTASCNQTWLTLSHASGTNNTAITLTAAANPTNDPRIAIITLSGSGVADKTITVTQNGFTPSLTLSAATLNIAAVSNSTKTFDISANTSWSISSSESWLAVSNASGSGNATITLTAGENPSTYRTATVTVSGIGVANQTIAVTQFGLSGSGDQGPDWTKLVQYGGTGENAGLCVTSDATGIYAASSISSAFTFEGSTYSNIGRRDLLITKFNSIGTKIWAKQYNAQADGLLYADIIKADASGNIYIAGTFTGTATIGASTITSSASYNAFIAKLDANGNELWATPFLYTGNGSSRLAFDGSGNSYLISKSSKILKFNSSGVMQWEQSYLNRTLQAIAIYGSNLYLGGALQGPSLFGTILLNPLGGYNTGYLVKADLDGVYNNSLVVGGSTTGDGSSVGDIAVDNSGNLLITGGYTRNLVLGAITLTNPSTKYYTYIAKCDDSFTFTWAKSSGVLIDNYRGIWNYRIFLDSSNNIYEYGMNTCSFSFGGVSVNSTTGCQFLVKFNSSGNAINGFSLQNTSYDRTIVTSDGKILNTGSSQTSLGSFCVTQYNSSAGKEWEKNSFNPSFGSAVANYIKLDPNGNLFVLSSASGKCKYFGNEFTDVASYRLLAKHDITGNLVWAKQIRGLLAGGTAGSNMVLDKNNNIAIVGEFKTKLTSGTLTLSQNNTYQHGCVLKYNSNGDILWGVQIISITGRNILLYTPRFDNSGNLIVSGTFSGAIQVGNNQLYGNSVDDVFLVKYDVNGNCLWARTYGGIDIEYHGLVSSDANDNIYLSGEFHSTPISIGNISLPINLGDGSTVLAKLDPNGNSIWAKTYGGVPGVEPNSWPCTSRTDLEGNTYLWGWCLPNSRFGSFILHNTLSFNGAGWVYYLCKIDTNGNVVWAKEIQEKTYDFNYRDLLELDNKGNIYVGGHVKDQYVVNGTTYNIQGVEDLFIAKYSNDGVFQWKKTVPQQGLNSGTIQSMAVYGNDILYVCGGYAGTLDFGSYKFKSTGVNAFIATLGEVPALPVAITKQGTTSSPSKSSNVFVTLKGLANANGNVANVSFEYGTSMAYGSSIAGNPRVISNNTAQPIVATFEGLSSELYHYRLKIETPNNTVFGDDMTISVQPPVANTLAASDLSLNSVKLNGAVNAKGNIIDVGFEYGASTSYGTTINATPSSLNSESLTDVAAYVSDLSFNTTYHYRVFTLGANPVYGSDMTFTTPGPNPVALIQNVTNLTKNSVTLNGVVNAVDLDLTAEFEYGLTTSYGNTTAASPSIITGSDNTNTSSGIVGLTPNTTYHYRLKVSGAPSVVYSQDKTFTTLPLAPVVTTNTATDIMATGATANGTVNPNDVLTSVSIEYGLTTAYGSFVFASPSSISGSGDVTIGSIISGLEMSTTYHYRVVAVSSGGRTNGDDQTFTTISESKPTVVTNEVTGILISGATLKGMVYANNKATTIEFLYGTDNTCATSVGSTPSSIDGSTTTNATASAVLSTLESNTIYYYKVKATNSLGTTEGDVLTFKTLPSKPSAYTLAASGITKNEVTLNGTANANGVSTNVSFEYGLTTDYGSTEACTPLNITGTGNTSVLASLSGLIANTTYHYRLKAISADGTTFGEDLTFTTNPLGPESTTNAASNITSIGATLNGGVNTNNSATTVEFEYGTTSSYGAIVNATTNGITGASSSFVASLNSLLPNTLYHFRVKATNAGGVAYGLDQTFTTNALPPVTATSAATSLSTTTASLNGMVTANGVSTTVIFEYGTTTSYGSTANATPSNVTGSAETNVFASISGLTPNTEYHYRVKSTNNGGTTYGSDQTFTTLALPPVTTTIAATEITTTTASLNATVNPNGVTATVSFEYGTTASYGLSANASPTSVSGINATSVSSVISGLAPNTVYHYRVKATNNGGTTNGADQTFTSVALAPVATVDAATALGNTVATLNGRVIANGVSTEVVFEYGTTTAYGSTVSASPALATGNSETLVSAALTGLTLNTVYHFRVKATNSGGVATSEDRTFTTLATGITGTIMDGIIVYPNPATTFINIKIEGALLEPELFIVDITGRVVYNAKLTSDESQIDISGLSKGSYFVKVKTINGEVVKQIIVK